MKTFLKKLFCLHLNWYEGRPLFKSHHPDDYVFVLGSGQIIPWTCTRCGKTKHFPKGNPPVQYLGGA